MKTVALAAIVVLMMAMGAQVATASGLEDAVKAILLQKAGQAAADALNKREAVRPQPVGELGTIRIEGNTSNGWYGSDMASALLQNACLGSGFAPVSVPDREIVREEAEIGGSPTVTPAEYIGRFTLRQGDGRWSDAVVRGQASRYGLETASVWAHMVFTVSRQGVIVASAEVEASDVAISIDAYQGWCRGFEFRTHEPTRQDLAVAAACQKAANAVAAKLAPRATWQFDPDTGRQLAREGNCFACDASLPAGANFCPKCGQDLRRPRTQRSEDPRACDPMK